MTTDPVRLTIAAGVILLYCLLCYQSLRTRNIKYDSAPTQTPCTASIIVAYASQTGFAESLAEYTFRTLHTTNNHVVIRCLNQLDQEQLRHAQRIFFIVSTTGEGDAPDNARQFVENILSHSAKLEHVQYTILALGDRQYKQFCLFGHTLENWLHNAGATCFHPLIEVDGTHPEALERWKNILHRFTGQSSPLTPHFTPWQLINRHIINSGSQGNPIFHLEFKSLSSEQPQWDAGDLAYIMAPDDPSHPRAYSIASLPHHSQGHLHLMVRQQYRRDGSPGLASHWLTETLSPGESISLQVRSHRTFHLGENTRRPLIFIGNGTGIAGLHALLLQRRNLGEQRNWLIFGERQKMWDFHYQTTIEKWQKEGFLARLDLAFSRDQPEKIYVQDRLFKARHTLLAWINEGAAIYVCGSANGMASAVDNVLIATLGKSLRDQLMQEGRYRRDIY